MRYLVSAAVLVAAGLVALPALAQPLGPPGPGERAGRFRDPEFRQRMIEQFDKDGDGQLSDEERQTMRETMRERFGRGGPGGPPPEADRGGPPEGPPPEGAPAERRRAEGRRGGEQPGGPGAGPGPRRDGAGMRGRRLEALFDWFDDNGDGVLSRQEFGALADFVVRHHPGPPGQRPGLGPRGAEGRRGPAAGPRDGFGRRGPQGGPPPRQRPADPPPESDEGPRADEPI